MKTNLEPEIPVPVPVNAIFTHLLIYFWASTARPIKSGFTACTMEPFSFMCLILCAQASKPTPHYLSHYLLPHKCDQIYGWHNGRLTLFNRLKVILLGASLRFPTELMSSEMKMARGNNTHVNIMVYYSVVAKLHLVVTEYYKIVKYY